MSSFLCYVYRCLSAHSLHFIQNIDISVVLCMVAASGTFVASYFVKPPTLPLEKKNNFLLFRHNAKVNINPDLLR